MVTARSFSQSWSGLGRVLSVFIKSLYIFEKRLNSNNGSGCEYFIYYRCCVSVLVFCKGFNKCSRCVMPAFFH